MDKTKLREHSKILTFCALSLRGAGQVMFMGNALTGVLFLAGIAVGSWLSGTAIVGVGAAVGLLFSTLAGLLLCERESEEQGLNGFNGILIGCALPTFFGSSWMMWIALVCLSAISPFLCKAMNRLLAKRNINSLTFPFIILTWLAFCFGFSPATGGTAPFSNSFQLPIVLSAWLNGISQVFLICSPICGALFLFGLLVANRKAALWCAIGSAFGIALASLFNQDTTAIANGLYGFNPALTAIALGVVFNRGTIITTTGIIATFFVQLTLTWLLSFLGIPSLTAPFCITTWLFLLVRNKM